jgi:hypothetical protein
MASVTDPEGPAMCIQALSQPDLVTDYLTF